MCSVPLLTSLCLLAGMFALAGCGGDQGIARYELSGQIKFDGKSVPMGYIRFIPDKKQGNQGPGTSATILDGHYKTIQDLGTVGGPHIAKIVGTDGIPYKTPGGVPIPIGRPLFPEIVENIDLPNESGAVHDFDLTSVKE
ncbi:MAG: hypothetical protein ABGX16_15505 [Pirellulales bacterium]